MKKNIAIYLYICILGFLISSCNFDDKSSLEVTPISDINIDTTGIPFTTYMTSGDELLIQPKASRPGVDESNLSYEWWITDKPGSDFTSKIVLSTEKELRVTIKDLMPSPEFYSLWYRVTDKTTKLMQGVIFQIVIDLPLKQGLVVADSENGLTSDLSYIQDTLFTEGWINKDTKAGLPTLYIRNEYSRVNQKQFAGIIHSLFAQRAYQNGVIRNFLHGASKIDIFRLNTFDYKIVAEGKNLFYNSSVNLNIDTYFKNSSSVFLVNGGKISTRKSEYTDVVTYNRFGLDAPGNYTASDKIAHHPTTLTSALFYDEALGKFFKGGLSVNVSSSPQVAPTATSPFNPANMPGYSVISSGIGNFSEARFLMKKDNVYSLFCLNSFSGSAIRKLDISDAPEIEKAIDFVFPNNQAVIYYATANKIYSIRIPVGSNPTYTALYTSPFPITHLEMLRRSGNIDVKYSEKVLLSITYDGSQGRITTFPIPESGMDLGLIDVSRSTTFGGFKKISAVAIQE